MPSSARGPLQPVMESQWFKVRALQNNKHTRVSQGRAQCRCGCGGSPENTVTLLPLWLQDDYSSGDQRFGGFHLLLPQLESRNHLSVFPYPLGAPAQAEPWQENLSSLPSPATPKGDFQVYPNNRRNRQLLAIKSVVRCETSLLRSEYLFQDGTH